MASGDRERWDGRHREAGPAEVLPIPFLDRIEASLPRRGRALDLAAGRGRVALALARRGLDTTACDVSPVGLALAEEAARSEELSLGLLLRDLEQDGMPEGPWDVVTCFHYLDRRLLRDLGRVLAPGGLAVIEIATVRNLERHTRPSRRFLLEEGELPGLLGDLTIVDYVEGWSDDRHLARLLARR